MVLAMGNALTGVEANFAQRSSLADKSRQLRDIPDAFAEPVYIADMDGYEALFVDKSLEESSSQRKGENPLCYARFQGLDAPCPFCSNHILREQDAPYQRLHHNELARRACTVADRAIRWYGGRKMRLSLAVDVTHAPAVQREKEPAGAARPPRPRASFRPA